jgi:hypothetical protein
LERKEVFLLFTERLYYAKVIGQNMIQEKNINSTKIEKIYDALARDVKKETKAKMPGVNKKTIEKFISDMNTRINILLDPIGAGYLEVVEGLKNIDGNIDRASISSAINKNSKQVVDFFDALKDLDIQDKYKTPGSLENHLVAVVNKNNREEEKRLGALRGSLSNIFSSVTEAISENAFNDLTVNLNNLTSSLSPTKGPRGIGVSKRKGSLTEGQNISSRTSKRDAQISTVINGNTATLGISIKAYLSNATYKLGDSIPIQTTGANLTRFHTLLKSLAYSIDINKSSENFINRRILAAILSDIALGGAYNRALIFLEIKKGPNNNLVANSEFLFERFEKYADGTLALPYAIVNKTNGNFENLTGTITVRSSQ